MNAQPQQAKTNSLQASSEWDGHQDATAEQRKLLNFNKKGYLISKCYLPEGHQWAQEQECKTIIQTWVQEMDANLEDTTN